MNFQSLEALDITSMLERVIILLGLDPNQISFEFMFNRLEYAILASLTLANTLALLGAIFYVATLLMRTIVQLRIWAIISDLFFIGYAVLANSVTTFILYLLLLPITVYAFITC